MRHCDNLVNSCRPTLKDFMGKNMWKTVCSRRFFLNSLVERQPYLRNNEWDMDRRFSGYIWCEAVNDANSKQISTNSK